jgi:uncharacterized protein (TIGR03435 family)
MSRHSIVAPRWTAAVFAAGTLLAVLVFPVAAADVQRELAAESNLAFEAATIKPAAPDAVRNRVVPSGPNRLRIPSMTLTWLVYTAYGNGGLNTGMRVEGGPDWVDKKPFAVEGVAAGKATPQQLRRMLQTLLEERFALKLRRETRIGDGLALVIDRPDGTLGSKVKAWNGTCQRGTPSEADEPAVPRCPSGYRPGGISLDGATMISVAEILSLPQSRVLLGGVTNDQTGLKGRYTMELDYSFPQRPADPTAPPDSAGASLSTAVREQWGLRFVPGRGPFQVLVVESAQPPTTD